MSRKRLVDAIGEVLRSELDTWGSDPVFHLTACTLKEMLEEIRRSPRVSIQMRHLARFVLRYVRIPDLTEFNAYLSTVDSEPVTALYFNSAIRADSVVPWICKRYAALGPCTKTDVLRVRRYL
jgi:hypothetical protein